MDRVDVVLGLFDAYDHGGDVARWVREDVTYRIPGKSRFAGSHTGREAMVELWDQQKAILGGKPYSSRTIDIAESNDRVFRVAEVTAQRPDGLRATYMSTNVYTVVEDQIQECWAYIFEIDVFDSLWDLSL